MGPTTVPSGDPTKEALADQIDNPDLVLRTEVLVNPGDDTYMPPAPRLDIDSQDLVIDPDATEDARGQAAMPYPLTMHIPAIVLPPRP